MKISEAWLCRWLGLEADTESLAAQLTRVGLEVDSITPAAAKFSDVVVGELKDVREHPDADKLSVCTVEVAEGKTLQIVCGASNVYAGMHAPVAMVGACLPGNLKIKRTKLRGVESKGMLCSARELGLSEDHEGIMDLLGAGSPGADLRDLLRLDDSIIDVDLTPNRGDCLGMEGIAREVAAAFQQDFSTLEVAPVAASSEETFEVEILSPRSCPRYTGRVIRNVDGAAVTPLWMRERLRRGGIRPIHVLVDITNYVMLELGQPMHVFDLSQLDSGIRVRAASPGERLVLLDGQEVELTEAVTVIADHARPLAIAGVMGGEGSGVRAKTRDVFLESAYFDPQSLAGVARSFGLHTDASHRFERGVDPELQLRAIERATALVLKIAGGEPGPTTVTESREHLPERSKVMLRRQYLKRLLGTEIPDNTVTEIFQRLGMPVESVDAGWQVTAPSHRFDIEIEADLVEEVARIYGYDKIDEHPGRAALQIRPRSEDKLKVSRLKDHLVSRGYSEAVTYSFVDPVLQEALFPGSGSIALENPIASNLSSMRLSLWPGLLGALMVNVNHRQDHIRLFENGMRFVPQGNDIKQDNVLAGIVYGRRYPEQWGLGEESVDFYDLKADVGSLIELTGGRANFMVNRAEHPALHPGRCVAWEYGSRRVGLLGELHPAIVARLELGRAPVLFEIELDVLLKQQLPEIKEISKFPEIRRDLAILVPEAVTAADIRATVMAEAPPELETLVIFDVYRGGNIDSGLKSVALGLILQDSSRTLTDELAEAVVADVSARLNKKLRARIRG